MTRTGLTLMVLAVVSLSPLAQADNGIAPFPHAATEPAGPSAVDYVMARFKARHTNLSDDQVHQVSKAIVRESQHRGVPYDLVLAVIMTESSFRNFATSHVGASGLMQIMPATGEHLAKKARIAWTGPEMLFDPSTNVQLGIQYLASLRSRFGDWDRALAAYNWGPGRINARMRNGESLPVIYSDKVKSYLSAPL